MTIADTRPQSTSAQGEKSTSTTTTTDLKTLVIRRIQDHIDRNFNGDTVSVLGTFGDLLEAFGDGLLDEQEMRNHLASLFQQGQWRPVWDRIRDLRPGDARRLYPAIDHCPAWCTTDAHRLPVDLCHFGQFFGVELTHHPYEVQGQTHLASMCAALQQEPEDAEPTIALAGHDEGSDDVMTLSEATAVSKMLARLVATGRAALHVRDDAPALRTCPSWCEEDHKPIELDDDYHTGPLLSIRDIDRDHVGEGRRVLDLLLSLRRQPDLKGTRVVMTGFESKEAYLLTMDEATELASRLLELVALDEAERDHTTA